MDDELFSVILDGKLKEGVDPKEAGDRLAASFKLSPDKIGPLLAGKPVIVKRGTSLAVAEKYKTALEQMGFESHIEQELTFENPVAAAPYEGVESKEPGPDSRTGGLSCPKCGYPQQTDGDFTSADECPKCGVIISKCIERPKGIDQESPNLIVPAAQPLEGDTAEIMTIEFPEPRLLRVFSALEFTLPGCLELPFYEGKSRPAPLKTRFFAALASLSILIYGAIIFQIPVALILLLMLMTGTLSHLSMGDAEALRVLIGLLAALYLFIYLPLQWNGLTYGQRLMGIWVAPLDRSKEKISLSKILLRFAASILNFASWGLLNFIWPRLAGNKNFADTLSSTRQLESTALPDNPVRQALAPIAYAFFGAIVFGLLYKPFLFFYKEKSLQAQTMKQATAQNTPLQEAQKRLSEQLDQQQRLMGASSPTRSRQSSEINPREVLSRLAAMQWKYRSSNSRFSDDLKELLRLYGDEMFPGATGQIFVMLETQDLKMNQTSTGFEIRLRRANSWQVVTESGYGSKGSRDF